MMKFRLIYLFVIATIAFSCKSLAQPLTIESIEIYYLPWNLKTRGSLTEQDVRNYNNLQNHFVRFDSDSIIFEFEQSVKIYNFKDTLSFFDFDVRMVLDFKLTNDQLFTILIGKPYSNYSLNRPIMVNGIYFRYAPQLLNIIDKNVPEKLALKGQTIPFTIKKGELSEKEIEEYKSKGVKIIEK